MNLGARVNAEETKEKMSTSRKKIEAERTVYEVWLIFPSAKCWVPITDDGEYARSPEEREKGINIVIAMQTAT